MSTPQLLNALTLPLGGSQLIEASAGTGKTFTIAALYLRLVLGHGGDGVAFRRALTPPEILVVTFSEAATKELRDRIRARLAEAAQAFLAEPADVPERSPGEDLLHDLRAEYPPAQWPACARTLRLAAEWMDEAAVSTIHGWCNRMLREHAFDSGALFSQTLETDQRELLAEAARDYWRTFFTPLSREQAQQVRQWWTHPEQLRDAVEKLRLLGDALGPGLPPAQALGEAMEASQRLLAEMKAPWLQWADELQQLLDRAVAAKQVVAQKLQARYYQPWLDGLRRWAASDEIVPLPDNSTGWTRLTPEGLAAAFKPGMPVPDHPALDDMLTLRQRVSQLPDGRASLLRHAAQWIAQRFDVEQGRRAQMGFDELLTRLDAALQGPNGTRLAALIRQQFPVALIDEFQDTDPLQYRIFDAVYGAAGNAQDTALVLIGDPKQAIYAFRGADIHTYLAARRDTEGRHSTLGTNFRSTRGMVEAVNHVFLQAEARLTGQGAFLFRDAAGRNPLPFVAVQARGRGERWWADGAEAPALTCWTLPEAGDAKKGDVQRDMAASCATEIVRLLNAGGEGEAGFMSGTGKLRALKAGDVAVLVNSGREARAIRGALSERGLRSVYLSDQETVFQSAVAADLQRWLLACAEPEDDRPLRAALGSATLGLPLEALDQLGRDELQWEAHVLQFRRYQQMWRRQGVLPMLRHLLHDFGVPQRLLAREDERSLTDLLHLAELLQQASAQLDGEHALIRWLAEQRDDSEFATAEVDARRLRLESDADLVKVITVHKSKGLEFPLVFLPFATSFRAAKGDELPLKWHEDDGTLVVALECDDEAVERMDRERLGEDLRKLYVALTRARYATWVGVLPLADVERSALGYLLSGGEPLPPPALHSALEDLAQGCDAIAVQAAPEPQATPYRPPAVDLQPKPAPPLPTGPRERWWIASYSALRRAGAALSRDLEGEDALEDALATPSAPASAEEDIYADSSAAEGPQPLASASAIDATPAGSLHEFARGAGPGSFLHGLLEWAGRQGFARLRSDAALQAELMTQIERRAQVGGWADWAQPLHAWLLAWLDSPLDLAPLGASTPIAPAGLMQVQIEMEFLLSAQQVDTLALDALVCRHTLGGAARPPLLPQQVNGMLKGYIDLVFEHEGRYYVADYKSNWLGPRDADYSAAAMRAEVLAHRYELQYVLYIFALHRLLRARLPDYDYERHMGGAVYLFLRGHAATGQGLHMERPPLALMNALDDLMRGIRPPPPRKGQLELDL
ncbi:exodeoxyribonuclease V subunit beta [Variovorax sp. OV329]|uniref:exodeoxyribonuclease V subunit beta n=1 Tax=Variovorax sp. OV329 TaxID=1882825 RepID=UPI0008E00A49|nr:exodeoxyribonuclease V subunit beta [Variovorax sp. OV329]SFL93588.1 DNA helicase/exodeoxyribonuclease V, beta subunit [Variovorax sp. OV329]